MTRYIDMSDTELVEYALRHPTGVPKLCYALAKRLGEVSKSPAGALEPEPPVPNTRPPSLVELHMQRGLSHEAKAWLKEKRPGAWNMCYRARYNQKVSGGTVMPIVTEQDCPTCRKAMLWRCLASPVCPRCEPHKLPEGLADYAPYEGPVVREIRELAESDQRERELDQ